MVSSMEVEVEVEPPCQAEYYPVLKLWGLLSINPLTKAMYCILERSDSGSKLLNNHCMLIHICLI